MTSSRPQGDANKALVQRFVEEVWNQGNLSLIDEFVALDFVEHSLWPDVVWFGPEEVSHREQISHTVKAYRDSTPDFSVTIDQLLDSDDKVTLVTTYRGTPTGHTSPITWAEISIYRIAAGKLAEAWVLWDRLGFWQQVGVVPPTRELIAQYNRATAAQGVLARQED